MDNTHQKEVTIVGRRSPEFVAEAVIDGKEIREINSLDFLGKYTLFFFYEADFSFVCPTEMRALQQALPEFQKRKVHVASVSVDSAQTHLAWLQVPAQRGGIQGITFMMISDIRKELSRAYCVLDEKTGTALRGTFIADKEGIVQYGAVNNRSIGRDIKELLRVVDAIEYTQKHGELCPVGWELGKPGVKVSEQEYQEFYKKNRGG